MEAQATRFPKTRQGVRDLDRMAESYLPFSGGPIPPGQSENVGEAERAVSLVAGGLLVGAALSKPTIGGLFSGALGCALIHRGYSGHCGLYRLLGINRSNSDQTAELAYPRG